ncbi:MAG: prenyltransferase/squalene oxidase repeat-containing protein [Isosphaeraceae bacterium]
MRRFRDRPRWLRAWKVRQRHLGAWLDRHADGWAETVPSWGVSVLLHALMLLMLALWLYVHRQPPSPPNIDGRFATQLTEDLSSLVPGDRAGDPFTKSQTDEPPSFSLEPPKPGEDGFSQPALDALSRFAPDFASPELTRPADSAPAVGKAKASAATRLAKAVTLSTPVGLNTPLFADSLIAPFSGRTAMERAKLVRREGGSVQSEKAVEAGLDWLERHQRPDGGWGLNFQASCNGEPCPGITQMEAETAATGLALLPLLGAGHIHTEKSRYQRTVRLGLEWLVAHQLPDGDLYNGGAFNAHLYSHAIATMALCEAYGLSNDPKLRLPAQRAIDYIRSAQALDGGWRYAPGMAGDTSVFGWQMFALRSARLAGLRISRDTINSSRAYLDLAAADSKKVSYAYLPGRVATPVMTAEALLARQYLGWARNHPALIKGASMVAEHLASSEERNIYYWYYATQLLHNMQNKDWETWNVRVRDGLVAMQVHGNGCDRGSWDPNLPQPDRWGNTNGREGAGRLFTTALSILTLEVYYRYLPLYAPTDGDERKLDDIDKAAAPRADEAGAKNP